MPDTPPLDSAHPAPISESELTAFRYMGLVAAKENPDDSLAHNFLRAIAEIDRLRADNVVAWELRDGAVKFAQELQSRLRAIERDRDDYREELEARDRLRAAGAADAPVPCCDCEAAGGFNRTDCATCGGTGQVAPPPAGEAPVCGHGCVICGDHRQGMDPILIDGRWYHEDCAEDRSEHDFCPQCVKPEDRADGWRLCGCHVCQSALRGQTTMACATAEGIATALAARSALAAPPPEREPDCRCAQIAYEHCGNWIDDDVSGGGPCGHCEWCMMAVTISNMDRSTDTFSATSPPSAPVCPACKRVITKNWVELFSLCGDCLEQIPPPSAPSGQPVAWRVACTRKSKFQAEDDERLGVERDPHEVHGWLGHSREAAEREVKRMDAWEDCPPEKREYLRCGPHRAEPLYTSPPIGQGRAAGGAVHKEDEMRDEVKAFAEIMERELKANDRKPGWKHDDPTALLVRLREEADELEMALTPPVERAAQIAKEAADVANFAMMIADVCGGLIPNAPTQGREDGGGALYEALEEIAAFAQAHHGDQSSHVLLHALAVDIPSMVAAAIRSAATPNAPTQTPSGEAREGEKDE
jgi:NTP pyrophosphatase (non-canonical NTP hydrolase)